MMILKIDVYSHILPERYLDLLKQKVGGNNLMESRSRLNTDLEFRIESMKHHTDVRQVLTLSLPSIDPLVSSSEAVELCKIANDELAEIVLKYPDHFIGAVACLPLSDMDAALKEADRAIGQLGLKGVQIFARISGVRLDDARFKPLYSKMAEYDLPIWIHPIAEEMREDPQFGIFGWPFVTSTAMMHLVTSGVFTEFPDIKFMVHHCGAMVPICEGRINILLPFGKPEDHPLNTFKQHFNKFYGDTATYGSTTALMAGYSFFPRDHLLFGTDGPGAFKCDLTEETISSILRMSIPEEDKQKIFLENALRLLKITLTEKR
jgi:uncharacterized protein